jgi:squalene-associated FAD-dependent desaturase
MAALERVAVVGAGYAGMAAAVTLADAGAPVTVFESGPVPGGRARRVQSRGETLDNGQHILAGAYATLFGLMRRVGVPAEAVLRMPLELRYAEGFALRALYLPAPLDLLVGLLAARGVSFAERIGALRFMLALRRIGFRLAQDVAVDALLERHGQTGRIGQMLWRPLCVSALNTPPQIASANVFLAVLRDTLAGEPGAADLLLPRVDLSRLFPEPAADYVTKRGGELRTGTPVRSISPDLSVDGEKFSHVILAVGPHQLEPFAERVGALPAWTYQPIVTCYLQYDAGVRLPLPMLGIAGGVVQWAFDRGRLLGERGRLACVISAEGKHREMEQDELAAVCHRELSGVLPKLAAPQWSRVITEKRATISSTPGVARPGVATPTPRLFLAGDYTESEYPPTLEAAVHSGVRAAQSVLAEPG